MILMYLNPLHNACCVRTDQSRRQSSRLRGVMRLSGGPKFETKHKNRCLQKKKLVNWRGQACQLEGPSPWRRPWNGYCLNYYYSLNSHRLLLQISHTPVPMSRQKTACYRYRLLILSSKTHILNFYSTMSSLRCAASLK